NLIAAELGVQRAERDQPMAWAARVLLILLAVWLGSGIAAGSGRVRWPGARAARALWVAATRPWRAAEVTADLGRPDRVLLVTVPAVALAVRPGIQTSFLAPSHLLVTLGAWLVFVLVLLVVPRRRSAWPVLAAVGGAAILRVMLLLVVLAPTGPGGYWFGFWTDPVARSAYIAVAFAAFGWVVAAGGRGAGGPAGGPPPPPRPAP